jgi:hypothetical protein
VSRRCVQVSVLRPALALARSTNRLLLILSSMSRNACYTAMAEEPLCDLDYSVAADACKPCLRLCGSQPAVLPLMAHCVSLSLSSLSLLPTASCYSLSHGLLSLSPSHNPPDPRLARSSSPFFSFTLLHYA